MQTLLNQHRDPGLAAFWIWGPYLRSDSERIARDAAERYAAPGSIHYWAGGPRFARDLAGALRLPAGVLAWDVYLLYPRGVVWDAAIPRPAYWQDQHNFLQGAPLDINLLDGRVIEALRAR